MAALSVLGVYNDNAGVLVEVVGRVAAALVFTLQGMVGKKLYIRRASTQTSCLQRSLRAMISA